MAMSIETGGGGGGGASKWTAQRATGLCSSEARQKGVILKKSFKKKSRSQWLNKINSMSVVKGRRVSYQWRHVWCPNVLSGDRTGEGDGQK